jgi:hypothetical protein
MKSFASISTDMLQPLRRPQGRFVAMSSNRLDTLVAVIIDVFFV